MPIKFDLNECGIKILSELLSNFQLDKDVAKQYVAAAVRARTVACDILHDIREKVRRAIGLLHRKRCSTTLGDMTST